MPSFGHLQLTTLLRGVLGPVLPDEPDQGRDAHGRDGSGGAGPDPDDLRARAIVAGASPEAAETLVAAVARLDARARAQVAHPLVPATGTDVLRLGTAAARQTDGTTCGSSVLAMLAAAGDPTLAYWLVTGRTAAGHRPDEIAGLGEENGPAGRFSSLQVAIQLRTNARALAGALAWPTTFGTPPWGAARVARYPGVRYRAALVDDTRRGEVALVRARVLRALDHGIPVPLYTGGDLSTGLATAVPRHVVLVTGRDAAGVRVYDPSSARVHSVDVDDLWGASGPRAELGGWSHVCWALLPVRP